MQLGKRKAVESLMSASCNVEDVIASDERVTERVLQLAVFELLCLFQCDVHIAVQTHQNAAIFAAVVQFDGDRASQYGAQKVGWSTAVCCRCWRWLHLRWHLCCCDV